MNRTLTLAVVGAAVLGIAAGAGYGRLTHPLPPSAGPAVAGQAGAASDQGGALARNKPSGAAGTQTAGRAPTSGTVELVEAGKFTVRTEGGTVDVPLSETTVVQKLVKASAADLKVGDLVVGRGSADPQGALHLSTLQIMPSGTERAGAAAKPGGQRDGRGGPAGGPATGDGADGRPGGVAGTVAKIDGPMLVVTTPSGDVTATLATDAEVRRLTTADRDEIKPGQTVTVASGPAGARTVVTITAV
jgi:hypothetical protein